MRYGWANHKVQKGFRGKTYKSAVRTEDSGRNHNYNHHYVSLYINLGTCVLSTTQK